MGLDSEGRAEILAQKKVKFLDPSMGGGGESDDEEANTVCVVNKWPGGRTCNISIVYTNVHLEEYYLYQVCLNCFVFSFARVFFGF